MDKARALYFTPSEQHILMEDYEESKIKSMNTAAPIKVRERAWQTVADRLYARQKKGHMSGTGHGPPSPNFTLAKNWPLQ
ncbi:hypothetical protein ATANTOWER_025908 [Ataeniobius toweri]|uniref:MADF domain-containing protein n=1 Tax=Ataeniobius toweri TaxID=208326 RepID=A0ABU7BWG7_9TELE|nr:hypothetical protein [Ataeniobius toweri]